MCVFKLYVIFKIADKMAQLSRGPEAGDDTDAALKAMLWESDGEGGVEEDEPNLVTLLMPYLLGCLLEQ